MARYPRLLHPVPVQIERVDIGATVFDDDAREPVGQVAVSAVVTIDGQVKYGSSKQLSYQSGAGVQENEKGYVLFRQRDLDAQSITLQPSDRIIKIGRVDHDVYITRLMPAGHYGEHGGNTLVKAFFEDRQPSKHRSR